MIGQVIGHLDELPKHKVLPVVYMRVSTWEQRNEGGLKRRVKRLRRYLRGKDMPCPQKRCFSELADSRSLRKRPKLLRAIEMARKMQVEHPNAVVPVVTDTRNRFVRGRHYNGQANTDPPSHAQLKRLARIARGVVLATVLPPDASFKDVRQFEMMGEAMKRLRKRKPNPGCKKERRERLMPEARRLHKGGASLRQISKLIGVPTSTVGDWVRVCDL